RLPGVQTAVSGALPQMDDLLRLTLRRRVPLPEAVSDGGLHPVSVGGEVRRLSAASVDVLGWLFSHDPTTLRELHTALIPRHRQDSIASALRELLRFGFLVVEPAAPRDSKPAIPVPRHS